MISQVLFTSEQLKKNKMAFVGTLSQIKFFFTRGPKCHLLGRIGPKKVLQTRSELASRLRASDDQRRKVGIFVKTRLGPREGPRGPKCHLLGRIGPKNVLQTRSEQLDLVSYNSGSNRARNFKSASRDYSLNCTPLGPITITNHARYYSTNCNTIQLWS